MKRWLIVPGLVTSQTDGDEHYVGASALMQLYGVNPSECVVFVEGRGRSYPNLTRLAPRYDGNYALPTGHTEGEKP